MWFILGEHFQVGLNGNLELRDVQDGGDQWTLHVDVQGRRAVQAWRYIHLEVYGKNFNEG